ncbi:hypothetical protein COOONC_20813 [Cooperia oncophora]
MTSSFDAYDLMRRSILSSIMGLRRKPRPSTTVERTAPGTACSSSPLPRVVHQPEIERTPHDIYREIGWFDVQPILNASCHVNSTLRFRFVTYVTERSSHYITTTTAVKSSFIAATVTHCFTVSVPFGTIRCRTTCPTLCTNVA